MHFRPSERVVPDGPRDIVADRAVLLAVAQQAEQEIIIAEHGQRALVDDRNVGEFEMGLQRVMRRDRRLDTVVKPICA